ncbi:MAG: hypothetical protein WCQ66_01115 [Sphaerochaetaceae bacterium]
MPNEEYSIVNSFSSCIVEYLERSFDNGSAISLFFTYSQLKTLFKDNPAFNTQQTVIATSTGEPLPRLAGRCLQKSYKLSEKQAFFVAIMEVCSLNKNQSEDKDSIRFSLSEDLGFGTDNRACQDLADVFRQNDMQKDLWETTKQFLAKHHFIIRIPDYTEGSWRFLRYPLWQRVVNLHEAHKVFDKCSLPTGSNCDVSAFEDMLCNKQRIDLKSLYFGDIGLNDEDLQSKDYILSVLFAEYLNYEKKPVVATEQTKADGFIVYIQQELDGYVLRDEEGEKMISLPSNVLPILVVYDEANQLWVNTNDSYLEGTNLGVIVNDKTIVSLGWRISKYPKNNLTGFSSIRFVSLGTQWHREDLNLFEFGYRLTNPKHRLSLVGGITKRRNCWFDFALPQVTVDPNQTCLIVDNHSVQVTNGTLDLNSLREMNETGFVIDTSVPWHNIRLPSTTPRTFYIYHVKKNDEPYDLTGWKLDRKQSVWEPLHNPDDSADVRGCCLIHGYVGPKTSKESGTFIQWYERIMPIHHPYVEVVKRLRNGF